MNVENLQNLYRVGQRILREQLPFGFGSYDCGTFACFVGWYMRDVGDVYRSLNVTVTEWSIDHFGISDYEANHLFMEAYELHGGSRGEDKTLFPGPAAYAELEKRMTYLAGLIREAGGTVPGDKPKHTGLPEITRKLFSVGEAA